jgi:hypothetical protein
MVASGKEGASKSRSLLFGTNIIACPSGDMCFCDNIWRRALTRAKRAIERES